MKRKDLYRTAHKVLYDAIQLVPATPAAPVEEDARFTRFYAGLCESCDNRRMAGIQYCRVHLDAIKADRVSGGV